MKVYQTKEIRNIALIGGAKSGKTTLSECVLFEGGIINRRGTVEDKNTISDYREIELERQNSVSSTVLCTEIFDKKVNFIDVPGFDDFVGELLAALKVTETAIMLVNAQNGVEVGTEITWRHTNKCNSPVIFASVVHLAASAVQSWSNTFYLSGLICFHRLLLFSPISLPALLVSTTQTYEGSSE